MAHYQKSLVLLSLQPGKIEEEEFQNYCKINQLILDVLTPVVRGWLEERFKTKNVDKIKEYKNHAANLKNAERTLQKYGNDFLDADQKMKKFPDNLDIFDLTACAELARYLLPSMQPKKVDTFEKIKWEKLKEKDAIHYSKIIKNEFLSHLPTSKIANDLFDTSSSF